MTISSKLDMVTFDAIVAIVECHRRRWQHRRYRCVIVVLWHSLCNGVFSCLYHICIVCDLSLYISFYKYHCCSHNSFMCSSHKAIASSYPYPYRITTTLSPPAQCRTQTLARRLNSMSSWARGSGSMGQSS